MTHDGIRLTYEAMLREYATTKGFRIAFHNVNFTPKANETYLKSNIIPAVTGSYTLAGDHTVLIGHYQVTVVTPLNTGVFVAEGIAKELRGIFKINDINNGAQQISPIETTQGFIDDTCFTYPLRFKYRCDFN